MIGGNGLTVSQVGAYDESDGLDLEVVNSDDSFTVDLRHDLAGTLRHSGRLQETVEVPGVVMLTGVLGEYPDSVVVKESILHSNSSSDGDLLSHDFPDFREDLTWITVSQS